MRILAIGAHADDIEIGCGGFIAKNIEAGNEVVAIILTDGSKGCPGLTKEEATNIRFDEAIKASKSLGYQISSFYGLHDGNLLYSEELRNRLASDIDVIQPDTILVTHEKESHTDHRAAGKLVREAVAILDKKPEVLLTEVWTPLQQIDRVVDISSVIEKKLIAIDCHKSQIERQSFDTAAFSLSRYRGIMQGKYGYAEVFSRMRSGGAGVKIAIMLLTYSPTADHPRAEYARKTLSSTLSMIDPGVNNELHVHIADDGSDPAHVGELIDIARQYGYEPTVSNAQRGGYGKSYNLACQALHGSYDLILPLEDDWELTRVLKLEYLVKALEENPDIRSIRLGYLGITQPLIGTVAFRSGMTYLLLDPNSPEPHVFCGHPRLETVEYQRDVGAWPEGKRAGETEWEITHRWPARTGVAWPLDLGIPASQDWGSIYAHIGAVSLNELQPDSIMHVQV